MSVPKNAKKPTDRKPKAEDGPAERTITVRGITLTVAAEALDDFELLDDLALLEDEGAADNLRASALPRILRRVAGDQARALMAAARDPETGRLSVEGGATLVGEVLAALSPNS